VPKVVDHDERKAEVAAAVWRAISRYGVEGATVRRIAKEAGYSTGVLAHYFEDKEQVLLYALREATDHTVQRMLLHAGRRPALSALREVALETLPLDETRRVEWGVWLAFWSRATTDDRLRHEHESRYHAYHAGLRTLVAAGQGDGSIRGDVDVDGAAEDLVCLLDGLGLQAMLEPKRLDAKSQEARVDRFLANLAPR
jgi:AcrR family transcriptional regulator